MENAKRNLLHIEVIRLIAAFFVIFNHLAGEGYTLFLAYPPSSFQHWLYLFFSMLCKINVPLFFMISGALLLKKQEEPFKKQLYRILRIVIVLAVFSLLEYIHELIFYGGSFQISYYFQKLIEDSWMIPYWFLYAYLGFLLTLPLLRRLANAMKEREFQYMILLVVLVGGLLPMVISLILGRDFSFSPYFTIAWVTSGIVCFPLLGHYLENVLDIRKITGFWLCIIWLISIGCLILTCVLTSRKSIETGFISETYVSSLVMVYSLAIYVSFRKLLTSHPLKGKPARFLQVLGSCTFGVYLMHGFLLSHPKLSLVHLITKNEPQLPLIAGFLRCFEIMIPLLFLTWLLKKIPGVRKLL